MSTPGVFAVSTGPVIRQVAGGGPFSRSRSGDDKFVLQYLVRNPANSSFDHFAAESTLLAQTGSSFDNIPDTVDGWGLDNYTWKETEHQVYLFDLTYASRRLETDEYSISVDTSGGSIRLSTAFATTRYAAPSRTAPDFKSSIDVRDGKPKGVDRIIPATRIDVRYRMTRPENILDWIDLAGALTGTVNSHEILGRQPGELLFLGFQGDFKTDGDPELNFSWAYSKNTTTSIGSIANVVKPGHDYVWILYEESQHGSGADAHRITQPRAAYVERIYTYANHNTLGLIFS